MTSVARGVAPDGVAIAFSTSSQLQGDVTSTFQPFSGLSRRLPFFVTARQFPRSTPVNAHTAPERFQGQERVKQQRKLRMRKLKITLTTILLGLGCFCRRCKPLTMRPRKRSSPKSTCRDLYLPSRTESTRKATLWEPMLTAAADFTVFC